jgi:hypothetical protein
METGVQLGGLYKKFTYLDQYRKANGPILVVDSGDLLNEDETITESVRPSAELKADLIARIFNRIGIDVINIGELDLVLGVDYLKSLEKKYNLPFVSANLVDENGKLLFKRYIIKNVNGKNVGVFGVIGDTSEMTSRLSEITGDKVTAQDPLKAAESVIKELTGKVDFIVALTHQGTGRDWVIARRVPGIDVVVGGHDKQKTKEASQAEKAYIVQAGEKGQYQGMLEISTAADGTKTAKNTLVPIGEEIANDAQIKTMISEYNDKVAALYEPATKSDANVPLKNAACEACHTDQSAKWKASDHAKAFDTLVKKSRQLNPDCLVCHTTRFEQPEGFSMKLQQAELRNVQCESCHGSATQHLNDGKPIPTPKPGKEICLKCHTHDRCPDFVQNYDKYWQKIKH